MRLDFDKRDIVDDEGLFASINEAVQEALENVDIAKVAKGYVDTVIKDQVKAIIAAYLGLTNRWSNEWEIKHDSVMANILDEKIKPLVAEMVDEIVGNKLEPDPEWLDALIKEAKERAGDEVERYIDGRISSSHGLDRAIDNPVYDAIQDAAREAALNALKEKLNGAK